MKTKIILNWQFFASWKLIPDNVESKRSPLIGHRFILHLENHESFAARWKESRVTRSFFQFRLVFPRRRCLIKCFPPRDGGSTVSKCTDHWQGSRKLLTWRPSDFRYQLSVTSMSSSLSSTPTNFTEPRRLLRRLTSIRANVEIWILRSLSSGVHTPMKIFEHLTDIFHGYIVYVVGKILTHFIAAFTNKL